MRKLIVAALAAASILCTTAEAAVGVIALFNDDKMIIGYTDYYGYAAFSCATVMCVIPINVEVGDTIAGSFDQYGGHVLFDTNAEREIRVYVDDYGVDADAASNYFASPY